MGATNKDVMRLWAKGTEKSKRAFSTHVDGAYLYDRGTPIAYRRQDGIAIMDVQRFSVTTTQHQNEARGQAEVAGLTIFPLPGNLLDLAVGRMDRGMRFEKIVPIDRTPDRWEEYQGVDKEGKPVTRQRHITGGSAFSLFQKFYICGEDEGRFFLSEVQRPITSYVDGLLALMPNEVYEATGGSVQFEVVEEEGPEFVRTGRPFGGRSWGPSNAHTVYHYRKSRTTYPNGVFRQGEWFFVPSKKDEAFRMLRGEDAPLYPLLNKYARPLSRLENGSAHIATRVSSFGERIYAKGVVRHERNEHRRLHLEEGVWYRVYKNLAVASWSVNTRGSGGMD